MRKVLLSPDTEDLLWAISILTGASVLPEELDQSVSLLLEEILGVEVDGCMKAKRQMLINIAKIKTKH